jgi:hypothetical protein
MGTFTISIINILIATSLLTNSTKLAGYLVVLFILCYSSSLGPVPWVLVGEILPAKGVSFTVAFDWTSMTLLSFFYKPIAQVFGNHVMFYFFSGCNIFVLILFIT